MSGFVGYNPRFRAFTAAGAPAVGYKLSSFAAGTSTPLALYADSGLTTPLSNPVILDANGEATFYIPDGTGYKLVLKDANDVVQWTVDNYSWPAVVTPATPSPVPTGAILPYGGSSAPAGFLLCDGSAVSRSTYAALFAIVATAFGAGNGSTTFNVPDLRGKFPLGKATSGTGSTLGGAGGTIDHVHTGPSHTHTIAAHTHTIAHTHTVARTGWGGLAVVGPTAAGKLLATDGVATNLTESQNDKVTSASSAADSGSAALTTDAGGTGNTGVANPPFVAVNYIIKT